MPFIVSNSAAVINSITATTSISDKDLDILINLDTLIKTNSTLIPKELAAKLITLAENQVDLVANGYAKMNEKLLSLLDMSLFLAM